MFETLFAKLAGMKIFAKIAIVAVVVALIFGVTMCAVGGKDVLPENQDPQNEQQQELQPEEEPEDDIIDIEDVEDAEDSENTENTEDADADNNGIKDFISDIIDAITGGDKKDDESENKEEAKNPVSSGRLQRFIVSFETNGGGKIGDKSVIINTKISKLPTPNREGYIFLGWCYDEALTDFVKAEDGVTKNLTLYAAYLEESPIESLETVHFAAAENVGKDFTIKVLSSDKNMTAEDVKAALRAKNLTNPAVTDFIEVTETEDGFIISGVQHSEGMGTSKGFEEGATYSIELNSDALSFADYPESAREFNFTTYKEEVLNFKLNKDIVFIPAKDLRNIINNGEKVETLDIALYNIGKDGGVSVASLTKGTFDYDKELKVGQIVSVYEGLIPTERTLDTPDELLGDIGYVEITAKNGNRYSYKNADPEDIIFTPDMLPVPVDADKDSNPGTITVDEEYFDFSADFYLAIDLDSQTKVEIGDFLLFYTGDLAVTEGENAAERIGFAEITEVSDNGDGTVTVAYKDVSWDYVDASMDVYTQEEITAAELLAGLNTEEIEAEIEQQAIESGFAEEAAEYLASLALATDNFSKLSDNMNLEDYKVVLSDGSPISPEDLQLMDAGVSVKKGNTEVKARVGTSPKHLGNINGTNADKKGLVIDLEVTSVFSIEAESGELEITVIGDFIEELGFDYGASSDTEWSWWGIVPYISEWTVAANVDVVNYTSVEITATMVTKNLGYEDFGLTDSADIAEQIKEILENNTNPETGHDHHTKLIEKYSEIVNVESDWIQLVELNVFKMDNRLPSVLPIIHLQTPINLVIHMDASVAAGFGFEYLEGTRYVFNVRITEGNITADQVSLKEKTYELCFYTMGRLAFRAGVQLDFKIGLFDTTIANIGFSAEAGPYTKLYGYFYYELRYSDSDGRSQKYSGALLTQVGMYFNLSFNAEAIGGKFSSSIDLVDKEWLLYEAGRRDNVLEFATAQEDLPKMTMRQYVRRVQLPDSIFNMSYLDLVTGRGETAIYNDWEDPEKLEDFRNGENFTITMTNDKFSYDPKTNEVLVTVDENDIIVEGEMIITWNQKAMSFSSKPIQRRVTLYWDNNRDGYMIVAYTNGGTYIPMIVEGYGDPVIAPEDPERLGYIFAGWYSDEELTTPYTFPKLMPNDDTSIYAKWDPATDIPYTVEHYRENLKSGEYELFETEDFEGTTDTYVSPAVKAYEGYISPAVQEVKVQADGSAVLRYYYPLQRNTVTFDSGLEGKEDVSYTLKYGASISAPQMAAKGYTFIGWTADGTTPANIATKMGTEALEYTAMWEENSDTEYRVEYYVQQIDGSYKLQHFFTEKGTTGSVITEAELREALINGVPADEKYSDSGIKAGHMTVKGIICQDGTATITGDGKLVVKINYARSLCDITFDPAYEGAVADVKAAYYKQPVEKPADPERIGYTFAGWDDLDTEAVEAVEPITVMIEKPVTYSAIWTPNPDTAYTVKHYQQNVDDLGDYTLVDTDNLNGTTATDVTPEVKTYIGFESPAEKTANIAADGSMVVEYYYDRLTYSATLLANEGGFVTEGEEEILPGEGEEEPEIAPVTEITIDFLFGESLILPLPERAGYGFTGWNKDGVKFTESTMPAEDITLVAQWEAGSIGYTVNHYQQNVGGGENYTLANFENLTADMDSDVTPNVNTYDGFTSPGTKTITIQADSKLNVIDYYYSRNIYNISWDLNGGAAEESYSEGSIYYNEAVVAPVPAKKGYSYVWDDLSDEEVLGVEPVANMPANDESYKAIWSANDYQVSFDLKGGTVVEPEEGEPISVSTRTVTFDTAYGELATLEKVGYIFDGWVLENGEKVTSETILSTDKNHTLYATYILITHDISYKFIDSRTGEEIEGVSNSDNPKVYSVEAHEFILAGAERGGYNFKGWFLDPNFTDGTEITGEIDFADNVYAGQTFYAKFEPVRYTVRFYQGTENEIPAETQVYYAEGLSVSEFSNAIENNKAGYTLIGWSTENDGTAEYSLDGVVYNLTEVEDGSASLYAVWDLNIYTITYNLGKHTNASASGYTSSYSVESAEDVVLPSPAPKSGFKFGGWYTDSEYKNPIEKIAVKEAKTDYTLYAKWEHGGTFNIRYTSKSNGKANFTINRTIPDGAVASSETQVVYVRTLNGTAYATTPEVASGYGQDKYHFVHNSAAIQFSSTKMSATFSVTENDDYLTNYMTASYQIGGKARNYYAEIYKVVSPSGGVNGVIGTNKRVTRTMAVSSYELTKDFFEDNWKYKMLSESAKTVADSGYDAYTSYVVSPADVTLGSALIDKYCDIVCNKYISYFRFEVRELDDAYEWVRISKDGTRIAEYVFEVKPGAEASDWGRSMQLPNGGTGKQGSDIIFDGSGCSVYEVSPVNGNIIYSDSAYDDFKIEFDASGKKGSDEWQYRNLEFYTKKLDRAEPAKQYVAPIALTDYKAGDEVMLTVIYNEAINKISGTPSLSLSSKLSPYFESPTYVNNGTGTNAIVFKVKVKADFNANTAQLINEYLAFPESSYKSNGFSGNIGSVSATVWDILGN